METVGLESSWLRLLRHILKMINSPLIHISSLKSSRAQNDKIIPKLQYRKAQATPILNFRLKILLSYWLLLEFAGSSPS
jgi:hypothetical protein